MLRNPLFARWGPPILVGVMAFVLYVRALRFGFVWDDEFTFYNNPAYRGLGWAQLKWMWTTFFFGAYRPLTWMTYQADDLLWGWRPERYHLAGVLLHALNASL